ncbi:MAG: bifunctional oligoribonuclease/PAP phosphatase NrnA [Bacteroidetes bacterium]|nr:bifunctional oligoribonuclease/PAP phosphatase NrnA [Bacteroidota bacterium]
MIENNICEEIKERIGNARHICIIPHVNPDGDAIGSVLGLHHLMQKLGKSSVVVSPNNFPEFLEWMPGASEILIHSANKEAAENAIQPADLIFLLDFNSPSRIDQLAPLITEHQAFKVLIDHHLDPKDFCDIMISDTSVSSASELLYQLIVGMGYEDLINADSATGIYVGIMTDTGSYSYSITPECHRITASLLEKGIDAIQIHNAVYDTYSESRMRLLGFCLSERMIVDYEKCLALIYLRKDDLRRFKYQPGDTEGVVNYALSIKGVMMAGIFIERKDYIKVSFRSKGNLPVNTIAHDYFQGGGHLNASGGSYNGTLDEAIAKFVEVSQQKK